MVLLKLLLVIISARIIVLRAGQIQDKAIDGKIIKIDRFGPCPRTNLPHKLYIQVSKCTFRTAFVTNQTIIAKQDFKDKLKITMSINRCRSRENLDSCEDYYKIQNLDYCKSISDEFLLPGSNPLYVPLEPKMKCPIKKGIYRANNFTFNITPFLMFPLDGWYWKTKMELFSSRDNNRRIGCALMEFYTHF